MAFEMIERFFAIEAAIHGFASSGTKLANKFCVERITFWALNYFLLKHFRRTELLFWIWRCNAKRF